MYKIFPIAVEALEGKRKSRFWSVLVTMAEPALRNACRGSTENSEQEVDAAYYVHKQAD